MFFKVLSLLLVSLSFVLMEENSIRENAENPKFMQKRYSEGTLASDYSRTLDNMLKKNFVEWLLNRRENMIDNRVEPSKREAQLPAMGTSNQVTENGSGKASDFIDSLLQRIGKQGLLLPQGSGHWKDVLRDELLSWLISADLCRPTTA